MSRVVLGRLAIVWTCVYHDVLVQQCQDAKYQDNGLRKTVRILGGNRDIIYMSATPQCDLADKHGSLSASTRLTTGSRCGPRWSIITSGASPRPLAAANWGMRFIAGHIQQRKSCLAAQQNFGCDVGIDGQLCRTVTAEDRQRLGMCLIVPNK
jgi:hypothetical protein